MDGAVWGEGLEFSFGCVKFEMNENTNSLKLRYKVVLLILYCDSVVIIYWFFFLRIVNLPWVGQVGLALHCIYFKVGQTTIVCG